VSFQPGMGLGLWFSKLMIDALSGTIEPRIEPSRVTFQLWIPANP
jgi:nitrogen-specific signal transduction histidine kinase